MPCPRTALLSACLDPEWIGARRELMTAHVQRCPICAAELNVLRALSAELQALPSPALGQDFSRPYAAAPSARRRVWPSRAWQRWRTWMPLGVTAAASLMAGVGLADLSWTPVAPSRPVAVEMRLGLFSPVPPGGLCAAAELCGTPKEPS
ncbi:zf-HC2 domain-containing protein [Castellaniella sp.]|uniref:anti-sigma factor family protein n=1 Tax=Castellaniella sp. TaxID=1955812 RepID=UPI002AFE1A69|nr:zf-HC2 domain-containing protein [Castellaniella sp.]